MAARKAEVETEEAQEAKFVPLEEADAEAQGRSAPAEAEGMDASEGAETEETIEDDVETPFIEVEEMRMSPTSSAAMSRTTMRLKTGRNSRDRLRQGII
jgi:hypothetical protein